MKKKKSEEVTIVIFWETQSSRREKAFGLLGQSKWEASFM